MPAAQSQIFCHQKLALWFWEMVPSSQASSHKSSVWMGRPVIAPRYKKMENPKGYLKIQHLESSSSYVITQTIMSQLYLFPGPSLCSPSNSFKKAPKFYFSFLNLGIKEFLSKFVVSVYHTVKFQNISGMLNIKTMLYLYV